MSASSNFVKLIDRAQLALYGAPAFALAIPLIPAQVLLPEFYAANTAVALSAVGLALLLARGLDFLTDPLIGALVDRSLMAGRGLRRMIGGGAMLCGGSLYQLFTPEPGATALYLFIWSALLFCGWSFIQIPYTVYAARLSAVPKDRLRLNGAREAAGILGIMAASIFVAIWAVDDPARQLRDLALLTMIAGGGALLFFLWFMPVLRAAPDDFPIKRDGWFSMLGFAPARRLVSAWFLNGIANGLPAVCFPLYLALILEGSSTEKGIALMLYFLSAVLAVPVWVRLSSSVATHRVWCWAMILACMAFALVPFLGPGDMVFFSLVCLVTGIAFGADLALPPAIQADVSDWDRDQNGRDRAGSLFALWGMTTKLALGLAAGIALPVLQWAGVSAGAESATEAGKTALILIYSGMPVVIKISAICLVWSFPNAYRPMMHPTGFSGERE
ncbi:MFS transporter [Aestuariispira insulae]|uniref:Na+/melibiose symporter-like transporter n=1 Tax=Aestuariispira insulae TaxID=1461337 RepID=A0A3D9H8G3_9PROT|nr:MFS transporter [Aestuariispira insulae]RED45792.1 Na+/melibiose symporter-like transporter [Aestuariispira insulae]